MEPIFLLSLDKTLVCIEDVPVIQIKHEEWLRERITLHSRLAPVAAALLENVLKDHGVDYLSVTFRVKDASSASEKIKRKKYEAPQEQLTDLSGLRVVVYFDSQTKKATDVIRSLFLVDETNSLDRSKLLGSDRMGYRSTHFVCSLGSKRANLPEYESIAELKFEVQIRTVLQHAWAELAHDRSYKFGPGLPPDIQRELNLYSGLLEIADRAFDKISSNIEAYQEEMINKTLIQFADVSIDLISLEAYARKMAELSGMDYSEKGEMPEELLDELAEFEIKTIGDLDKFRTEEMILAYKNAGLIDKLGGLIRNMLMFEDLEKYFSKEKYWDGIDDKTIEFLSAKYTRDTIKKALTAADMTLIDQ